MSKIRSRLTSFGYTLRRAYQKITAIKPSVFLMAIIITAVSIFFLGGGIYDILEKPLIGIPLGTSILFFYPGSVYEQTILDSLFVMISYFFGVLGLLLVYQSTKYAYKPRQAFMLLLLGALFILIAYFNVENLIHAKLTVSV